MEEPLARIHLRLRFRVVIGAPKRKPGPHSRTRPQVLRDNVSDMGRLFLSAIFSLGAALAADNWKPLFNGQNLDGWTVAGSHEKPGFTVGEGAIHTEPGHGMLWYSKEKLGNGTL